MRRIPAKTYNLSLVPTVKHGSYYVIILSASFCKSLNPLVVLQDRVTVVEYQEILQISHPLVEPLFSNVDAVLLDHNARVDTAYSLKSWTIELHNEVFHLLWTTQ